MTGSSAPEYPFAYPNGVRVQPVAVLIECRVVGGELELEQEEVLGARYFGADGLPKMRSCCVGNAHDAFAFEGRAFVR